MVSEEILRREGVEKVMQTESGRKYLDTLREEQYKYDAMQPNHPDFQKVWGSKLEKIQKLKEKNEALAKGMWEESKEKRKFEKEGSKNVLVTGNKSVSHETNYCPRCNSSNTTINVQHFTHSTAKYRILTDLNCKDCKYSISRLR